MAAAFSGARKQVSPFSGSESGLGRTELVRALDLLLVTERGCAKAAAASIRETDDPGFLTVFERSGRCAARHVEQLQAALVRLGAAPSVAIGPIYGAALSAGDLAERETLLFAAEEGIVRQIDRLLAKVDDAALRTDLASMRDLHQTMLDQPAYRSA